MKKEQLNEWVHQLVSESNIEVVKEIQLGETTVRLGKATDASFHKQGGSMIVQLISNVGSVGLDKRDVRALIGYIKKMMGYSYMPRLKEGFDLKKLEDAIKVFQSKIKKQGNVTNARDEEHLEKLIKVYKEMGGKKIKEGKLNERVVALPSGIKADLDTYKGLTIFTLKGKPIKFDRQQLAMLLRGVGKFMGLS
tara:strand:- start:1503 stop:2084 length:582 start_codon:yes stop_codon:yes gene_type:complete